MYRSELASTSMGLFPSNLFGFSDVMVMQIGHTGPIERMNFDVEHEFGFVV